MVCQRALLWFLFQRCQCRCAYEPRRDMSEQWRGMDIPDQQGRPRRQGHSSGRHSGHQKRLDNIHPDIRHGKVRQTPCQGSHM